MDFSTDVSGVGVPIRVVAGYQESDPATGIPPDGSVPEVPAGTGAEAAPFTTKENCTPDFERDLASLRAADAAQTFIVISEPSEYPDSFGPVDADSD